MLVSLTFLCNYIENGGSGAWLAWKPGGILKRAKRNVSIHLSGANTASMCISYNAHIEQDNTNQSQQSYTNYSRHSVDK